MLSHKEQFSVFFNKVKSFSSLFTTYKQKSQTQQLINSALYDKNQDIAQDILKKHGKEALDYFKTTKDKSIFIRNNTVISFKIIDNNVIVLGDPVGPQSELEDTLAEFMNYCDVNSWNLSFFQSSNKFLSTYHKYGFDKLKIGSEAIVDVADFDLVGPKKKDFRNRIRKLEKLGFFIKEYSKGAVNDELFAKLKVISDEWLDEPNRIERNFSLGYFSKEYINNSTILTVENEAGDVVAFVNLIPSFKNGQITIDLMRKSKAAPSGVMDYIFVKAILELKEQGYNSLSLGLAPMSGFQKDEEVTMTEKTVYEIFKRLNFLFNYEGLKVFKDKFATSWDSKFLIYRDLPQLPGLAFSIKRVLEEIS